MNKQEIEEAIRHLEYGLLSFGLATNDTTVLLYEKELEIAIECLKAELERLENKPTEEI